ncbi:MAG: inositol monophosphatase family protein [Kiloniellales bacterium]|nr:inositol monophosphatase family protein [Kiloniellales bacterium]MDJ0980514.1 inositol monophosphatase family protein [Kiloniellales bacterium]
MSGSSVPIEEVTRILVETAAEEVLPRFRNLGEDDTRIKAGGEVVTVVDEASERRLTQRLRDLLPGSLVVGEEAAAADPGIFANLLADEAVWLIDPIDGTSNFAQGVPVFAMMLALVERGETCAAWIHDVPGKRTGVAERGSGSWIDGRRLVTAPAASLGEMTGTLHAGQFGGPELRERVRAKREKLGAIRSLSCAGAEYLRLAAGEMHYSLFTKLMPWDHAPGVLLHAEAGGHAWTAEDQPYSPLRRESRGLLLAPDEASWRLLHDELYGDAAVPTGGTPGAP